MQRRKVLRLQAALSIRQLMKILVLNPQIDAAHEIATTLQTQGHALFFAETPDEAWQILQLHRGSMDLALAHRESMAAGANGPFPGLDLLKKIRTSGEADLVELPFVLTTQSWSDDECVAHQSTPEGAHAYLHWPATSAQIQDLIREIFGDAASAPQPDFTPVQVNEPSLHLEMTTGTPAPREMPVASSAALQELPLVAPGQLPIEEAPAPSFEVASEPDPIQEMPYLYRQRGAPSAASSGGATARDAIFAALESAIPLGDAVVPGGAAQTPDTETLKKYLLLREQDVAALSSQLKAARDQIKSTEDALKAEQARSAELVHVSGENQKKIDEFERDKHASMQALKTELSELQFEMKAKDERVRALESQVKESVSEIEQIKERVRQDIRKIRVREKDLENRLEITRRDSEALLTSPDHIELKRKLDLLEFNMDLLQEQHTAQRELNKKLQDRLARAAQVVRVAGGLLVENAKGARAPGAPAEEAQGAQGEGRDRQAV